MNKSEFNVYCAEVMGYMHIYKNAPTDDLFWIWIYDEKGDCERQYAPYDDLNQMLPVADEIIRQYFYEPSSPVTIGVHNAIQDIRGHLGNKTFENHIRDFIISTMPDKQPAP